MTTGYLMVDQPNPYTAQGTYPRRGTRGKLTGTAILHTSQGNWRAGVDSLTNLVRTRSDWGCYHQACDWQDIARYYPWEWETWQDTETNNWAVGIAAACKTSDWATMPDDIREGFYINMGRMAADFVVYMATTYGITVPLVRISGEQARAGVPGFCAHGDSGVHRSDPGVDFDWAKFFKYTQQALGGAALAPQGKTTDWTDMFKDIKEFKDTIAQSVWAVLEGKRGKEAIQKAVWGFDGGKRNGKQATVWRDLVDSNTLGRQLLVEVETLKEVARQQAANPGTVVDYDEIQKRVSAAFESSVESVVQKQETTTTEITLKGGA
jgi:hypothetical protein